MTIFRVTPVAKEGETPKSRLIKAERRSNVESFLIGEFSIEKATPEETHSLGKSGVEVEDTAA